MGARRVRLRLCDEVQGEDVIMRKLKEGRAILLVEVFACIVYVWGLWNEGFANLYYSAGVYSMGQNLHAFLFNSLDSVGFISIDKPPLGFWIQVVFTKIFGFSGMSILLPQAIAGVISVFLIYRMIGTRFGKTAGITAALVLAATPIMAAVTRNNTIDSILILTLLLASGQLLRAVEKSSPKHLLFAGIFIGLGFNIKMLQAFMIVPAVYLTYILFSKQKMVKRLLSCLLSVVVLLTISASWMLVVDLTPAQDRPYVGSSGTNSEFALAIGYNGLKRLGISENNTPNQSNPALRVDDTARGLLPDINTAQVRPAAPAGRERPPYDNTNPSLSDSRWQAQKTGGMRSESGAPSVFRLFHSETAGQISWFLLPAGVISLFGILGIFLRKMKGNPKTVPLFYFSMCFLPMFIYFSFSSGMAHRYYLAMLAFPIAALLGIGVQSLLHSRMRLVLLPVAFAVTAASQLYIQSLYTEWLTWLVPSCAILFGLVLLLFVFHRAMKRALACLLLGTLLILPAAWSITPLLYGDNTQLPIAGPELLTQGNSLNNQQDLTELIAYLEENRGDATYLACVPSAIQLGSQLILQSGEAVMCLGGFNGSDQPLRIAEFKQLILQGTVKYAVVTAGRSPSASNTEIFQWITSHCSLAAQQFGGSALYDLSSFKE